MTTVDTGQKWLGAVPSTWHLAPLGTIFQERKETVSDTEFPALSVTKKGVVPQLEDVAKTVNNDSRKLVRAGDFVINSRSDRKGSSGVSALDGSVSVIYTVLQLRDAIYPPYAHHLLRSTAFQEEYYRWGTGIVADLWSTRYSSMKQIQTALPPLDEQQAIADYLDRETQRIDELIAEQRGLIEALRERRQASIDLRTSDVGTLIPLRRIVSRIRQGWSPNADNVPADGIAEWGVLKVGCSNTGIFRPQENKRLPDEVTPRSEHVVLKGEIVMSRSNTRALVGAASLVQEDFPRLLLSDLLYGVQVRDHALAEYVMFALRSRSVRGQIEAVAKGMSASMQKLSQSDILNLEIKLPSASDQRTRADAIRGDLARIDDLIAESEDLIALSQERRAALITAAVTGQIDVRTAA